MRLVTHAKKSEVGNCLPGLSWKHLAEQTFWRNNFEISDINERLQNEVTQLRKFSLKQSDVCLQLQVVNRAPLLLHGLREDETQQEVSYY